MCIRDRVHTLPGPAPARVVPRVPRSTLAFRERGDAAARARLGQGSPWAASRRALCSQEPSALGRLRAHRRGAGGLVTISRLWISLRSPGCRLVSCGSTTPTATARAHMGSTALARCRRGAARDGWPWPQRGACPARWSATPSGGSWQRGPLRRALLGDICSQGWAFHSHPGRVRASGPVLTSGHGPERAARRYLQPLDSTRLMATFLAFGLLAAGGQMNVTYTSASASAHVASGRTLRVPGVAGAARPLPGLRPVGSRARVWSAVPGHAWPVPPARADGMRAASRSSSSDSLDPRIMVPASPSYVSGVTDLGGPQRLAVDFSRGPTLPPSPAVPPCARATNPRP